MDFDSVLWACARNALVTNMFGYFALIGSRTFTASAYRFAAISPSVRLYCAAIRSCCAGALIDSAPNVKFGVNLKLAGMLVNVLMYAICCASVLPIVNGLADVDNGVLSGADCATGVVFSSAAVATPSVTICA